MAAANQKVLLVDDDPAMLRLLAKWLETAGYQTIRAGDGRQAIAAIETECPDILITDWEMPHVDGLDLCRWLREQKLPHYVYTIFLTVRNGLEDIIKGLEAGADDFVKKPVDRGELLARLKSGERLVALERRLSVLASTDSLTELATRRIFFDHLNREFSRSRRNKSPLSCLMLDIDFFKRVNDTWGHPAGDEVIRRVAAVLRENVRPTDLICRFGGEEFCIALSETDEKQAAMWAERLRQAISACRIVVDTKEIAITASIGVAELMDDTCSPDSLVDRADQALMVAKQSGRDRSVTYRSLGEHIQPPNVDVPCLEEMFANVPASSAMTVVVAGLKHNDTVANAARYFLRFPINSAPVVDDDGKLVGILAERDLISATLFSNWWETPIEQVMKRNVVCYDEKTPISVIHEFLGRVAIRGVVIVRDGRPVGMISRTSFLRWLMNNLFARNQIFSTTLPAMQSTSVSLSEATPPPTTRLVELTIDSLAQEIRSLEKHVKAGGDLLPCVVGGASRIQEMANELLSCARFLNQDAIQNHGNFGAGTFCGINELSMQEGLFATM